MIMTCGICRNQYDHPDGVIAGVGKCDTCFWAEIHGQVFVAKAWMNGLLKRASEIDAPGWTAEELVEFASQVCDHDLTYEINILDWIAEGKWQLPDRSLDFLPRTRMKCPCRDNHTDSDGPAV